MIPNYNASESVFIFKCHQCMADGLGIMNVLLNLQDKYDEGAAAAGKATKCASEAYNVSDDTS